MAYHRLPVAQFVPLSLEGMPRIARQQGIIRQNELSFESFLEKALTPLMGSPGSFPVVNPIQKNEGMKKR